MDPGTIALDLPSRGPSLELLAVSSEPGEMHLELKLDAEPVGNSAMSETSEMSEELENTAESVSGVRACPALAATPAPLGPVSVVPAPRPGGPAGPEQECEWYVLQRGMERQQEWMRLITQVMHSLAAACQTELTVHLLQSRFALDGYVELFFRQPTSSEHDQERVLKHLYYGMNFAGLPA